MFAEKYLSLIFIDVPNQTNLLLNNLKLIVDKLQSEKAHFKIHVEKLKIEKKQLIISNKSPTSKVDMLEKHLQRKVSK